MRLKWRFRVIVNNDVEIFFAEFPAPIKPTLMTIYLTLQFMEKKHMKMPN